MEDTLLNSLLAQAPILFGAAVVLIGFARGWLHSGREFDAVVAQKDKWEDMSIELLRTTRTATGALKAQVENGDGGTRKRAGRR